MTSVCGQESPGNADGFARFTPRRRGEGANAWGARSRERVEAHDTAVPFVCNADNLADVSTKPLAPRVFFKMRDSVMIVAPLCLFPEYPHGCFKLPPLPPLGIRYIAIHFILSSCVSYVFGHIPRYMFCAACLPVTAM
eukprot:4455822-Pleurochrysis_carterae.AAC.3